YNKYLLTSYKIQILKSIAKGLNEIHSKGLIHQDIHSGNILSIDFDRIKITDLGLSKFANQHNKEIRVYGILPYIAPEVLQGQEIDEIKLTLDICKNGLRPKIHEETPKILINLLKRCWNANPLKRPTSDEILKKLSYFENNEIIFENLRNFNNG